MRSVKQKILDTACGLFLTRGFKSVTMDDLSDYMGISKKTIYAHFENKTDLVAQCTMYLFNRISGGIDFICTQGLDPIEELYEIKKFAMNHLKNEKASPVYQLKKYYPPIFEKLQQKQFEVMKECVRENVTRGIDRGIYRPNLNVDFVARIYFTGITSLKDDNLFPQDLFSKADLVDMYLEYHLRGIVTPKGRMKLNTIINSNQN